MTKPTLQELIQQLAKDKATCARCGCKDARLGPVGLICPNCTFGGKDGTQTQGQKEG